MKIIVNILRILVGGLFIFSGFVKLIDPLGFSYKLEEYFYVFGTDFMVPLALFLSVFFTALEIVLGFALLLGAYRRVTSILLLLLIIFFTWLTGFSAVTGKVTDCGCFGDFLKLTPHESFYKDVVLLVMIVILFFGWKKIIPIVKGVSQHVLVIACSVIALWFSIYNYRHLPVFDFRAYAVGENIWEGMQLPPDANPGEYQDIWYYEDAAGNVKEYTTEEKPWEDKSLTFVDRKTITIVEPDEPPIHDFMILDLDGEDFTQDILFDPTPILMVIAYDLPHSSNDGFEKISALAEEAEKEGIKTICLTASTYEQIEKLRHDVQAAYPFYMADATALKTIIRSNPGIVLLKEGTVLGKWHHHDTPELSEVKELL